MLWWKGGKEVYLGHEKEGTKGLWTERISGMEIVRRMEKNFHHVRRDSRQFREFGSISG